MTFKKLSKEHVEEARKLALSNYEEERLAVPELPAVDSIPMVELFAENGLGIAAFENDKMVGFLGCFEPWIDAFDFLGDKGTFCPLMGHGAVKENRVLIYQKLFEKEAEICVAKGISSFAIALYAHDSEAKQAFFEYGFGQRCADKIRPMESIGEIKNKNLVFEELEVSRFPEIRNLRIDLNNHLLKSPCFLKCSDEELGDWLEKVESGDRRTFVARGTDGKVLAYIDITGEGENFVGYDKKMRNIHGTYCVPEFRGQNVIQDLLEHVILTLKTEGFELLGVDHESTNPTANRFWRKYFTDYTCSVLRKIF